MCYFFLAVAVASAGATAFYSSRVCWDWVTLDCLV